MISFLLDKTHLTTRNRFEDGVSFRRSIGTPPGDSLSLILFTIYSEAVVRNSRNIPLNDAMKLTYADVASLVSKKSIEVAKISDVFGSWD